MTRKGSRTHFVDRERALAAGFDVHVGKPVPLDELRELLANRTN
jgi:CheY-like chemotaxis protein